MSSCVQCPNMAVSVASESSMSLRILYKPRVLTTEYLSVSEHEGAMVTVLGHWLCCVWG